MSGPKDIGDRLLRDGRVPDVVGESEPFVSESAGACLRESGPLAAFPVEALGESIGPLVRAAAEAFQVPPELPALGALATLSAAALKRVAVRVRTGWREQVALYAAPVLEPGERKTAALGAIAGPLRDFERERERRLAPAIRESQREHADAAARVVALERKAARAAKGRDGIVDALQEARGHLDKLGEPLRVPRLFADDTTPEALARLMANHDGRAAVFSSEGGIFDTLAGRYANGTPNLDLFLKAWDGAEDYYYDRVGMHLRIPSPLLAVCLFVQPDVLAALSLKPGFRGRGLIGRFCFAVPSSRLGARDVDPPPVPDALALAWRSTVERVASLEDRRDQYGALVPSEIELERAALAELLGYAREVEERLRPGGDLRPISDWAGKHVGTVARIAGLLHIADAPGNEARPIPAETLRRALAFGRAMILHAAAAIRLMAGGGGPAVSPEDRQRRELVSWIAKYPGSTARDAARRLARFSGPGGTERAKAALDELAHPGGPVRREPGPRTDRYFVHGATDSTDTDTSGPYDARKGKCVGVGNVCILNGAHQAGQSDEWRPFPPGEDAEEVTVRDTPGGLAFSGHPSPGGGGPRAGSGNNLEH